MCSAARSDAPGRATWYRKVASASLASMRAVGSSSHDSAHRTSSSDTSATSSTPGKSSVSARRLTRLMYLDLMKKLPPRGRIAGSCRGRPREALRPSTRDRPTPRPPTPRASRISSGVRPAWISISSPGERRPLLDHAGDDSFGHFLMSFVQACDTETNTRALKRQLVRGPDHLGKVSHDLLGPRSRQDRHQLSRPRSLVRQEVRIERPVLELIEVRVPDVDRILETRGRGTTPARTEGCTGRGRRTS